MYTKCIFIYLNYTNLSDFNQHSEVYVYISAQNEGSSTLAPVIG